MSNSVPGVESQSNLNVTEVNSSPSAFVTCSPGQPNSLVVLSVSQFLTGVHWAIAKTTMMIAYGAYARTTSPPLSCLRSLRAMSASSAGLCASAPATAGRPGTAPSSSKTVSDGCQTRSNSTIDAAETSDAMMSVSSTET